LFIYFIKNIGQGGLFLKSNSFLKNHIETNIGKYILASVLFIAGVCIGAVMLINLPDENAQALTTYFSGFTTPGSDGDIEFTNILKSCMVANLKYMAVYFALSLTFYSAWLCMGVPAAKGFASGFTCAFLIKNYGFRGVIYSLISIAPSTAALLPVYLFAAIVCINFASQRRKRGEVGARSAVAVIPALAVIYCIMTVCSLFDVFISPVIFKYVF